MAQFRKDTHQYLNDGKTIFEVVMLADQYGNLVGPSNPTGMSVDAFGRARTSQPLTVFDSSHRYDDNGLWATSNTATATYAFDSNEGLVDLVLDTTSDAEIIRETTKVFGYQPGKALRHGEPILTTNGWKNIEDMQVGDEIFDGLGNITNVVGVFPQGKRKIYRFTFDDETFIDADEEHLWVTIIRKSGKKGKKGDKRILTTKQMIGEQGNVPKTGLRWRIPASPVLNIEKVDVTIDPYTLGAILGDGHITSSGSVSITTADEELLDFIKCSQITKLANKYGYGLRGLSENIRQYVLEGKKFDDKFVPTEYLFNDSSVRLSVLQGLMDTDGWIERDGCCYIATGSKQLSEDIAFLVRSLGGQAKIKYKEKTFYNSKNGTRIECSPSYKVVVIMQTNPFKLSRKAKKWRKKYRTSFDRYVYSIEEIGEYDATCIRVASEDHTFITKNHIVTHNSLQILNTFVMEPAKENLRQRIGYFGAQNGLFLEQDGTDVYFVKRSYITGSVVETKVAQANWNIDVMDGTGPSLKTLDLSKAQILFCDIEWLGVGSVRMGFVIDGQFIHCHSFHHANEITSTYITTASLPLRYEIKNTGATANNSTLKQICSSVISEGGYELRGSQQAIATPVNAPVNLAVAGTFYPIVSLRLKNTRNDAIVIITALSMLGVGNNARFEWRLLSNPTIGGNTTFTSAGTNSSVEYNQVANTVTGGRTLASGYLTSTTQASVATDILKEALFKFQLERDSLANTSYPLTVAVAPATGGDDVLVSIDWEEVSR